MENQFERNLTYHLKKTTPGHKMAEAYHYAVLPAGKLFRPKLVHASWQDLYGNADEEIENPNSSLSKICSAIEIHHAYTLVHDDLPSMDNDDYRRGKLSTHKKYGEWQALLVGDGLLNISYQLLASTSADLIKFFSWAVGPKGLIFGQYLDLSHEANKNLESLILVHQLKTARLIQSSLIAPSLISDQHKEHRYNLFKLGHRLGICFQLLDDLTELCEPLEGHEKEINPWPKDMLKTKEQLEFYMAQINELKNSYKNINTIITDYLSLMKNKIENGRESIKENLNGQYPESLTSLF